MLFINIDKFEPNPILVNINKLKPYKYLGKNSKGLEATIEGGGELTRRIQKTRTRKIHNIRKIQRMRRTWKTRRTHKNVFWYGSTKHETTPKTLVNKKKFITGIGNSKYKTTKSENIFNPSDFDID